MNYFTNVHGQRRTLVDQQILTSAKQIRESVIKDIKLSVVHQYFKISWSITEYCRDKRVESILG